MANEIHQWQVKDFPVGTKILVHGEIEEVRRLVRREEGGFSVETTKISDYDGSPRRYHPAHVEKICERGSGKLIVKKDKSFDFAHFPVGTIFEAEKIRPNEQFEVKEIVQNGAYSFVLVTTQPAGTHFPQGMMVSLNVQHVTGIIKRGSGAVFLKKDKMDDKYARSDVIKGRKQYRRRYSMRMIVARIVSDIKPASAVIDMDKLFKHLLNTGVIKEDVLSDHERQAWEPHVQSAQKMKLRRSIRRNLGRFMVSKKSMAKIEADLYEEEVSREALYYDED